VKGKKVVNGIRRLLKKMGMFLCNKIDSHIQPLEIGYDGISLCGKCPRCGAHILQDSQGNWFGSGREERVEAALAARAKDLAG
jgi:hypothetical protein